MCDDPKLHISLIYRDGAACSALIQIFENEGYSLERFETACNFLDSPPATKPTCIVLGIQHLDLEEFDHVARILDEGKNSAIVVVTVNPNIARLLRDESRGDIRILEMPADPQSLITATKLAYERVAPGFCKTCDPL